MSFTVVAKVGDDNFTRKRVSDRMKACVSRAGRVSASKDKTKLTARYSDGKQAHALAAAIRRLNNVTVTVFDTSEKGE